MRGIVIFLFCLLSTTITFAAGQEAGTVVSVVPGAFVERNGARMPLEAKALVHSGDVLSTDDTGRVRVWMRDDTTLSLGPNTEFDIEEFANEGSKPVFKGKMTGLARMLTGEIVNANPEGFKVSTPQCSVGIRGTIITVEANKNATSVYVENTLRQVLVNGMTVPSGSKGLVQSPGALPQIMPITPADRQRIGAQVAARNGASSASANSSGTVGVPVALSGAGMVADNLAAGSSAWRESTPSVVPPVLPGSGIVAGTLSSDGYGSSGLGAFSFSVDFASGTVSDAKLSVGNPYSDIFRLSDGSGKTLGSSFSVDTFNAAQYSYFERDASGAFVRDPAGNQIQHDITNGVSGSMQGTLGDTTKETFPVTGSYNVAVDPAGTTGIPRTSDSGTLNGTGMRIQ